MSGNGGPKRRRRTKGQKDYMQKLRDPRWQKLRNQVLERDGYTCSWCGAGVNDGRNLQVHHGFYAKRFEGPWEYPMGSLFTLCELCHPQAESVKQEVLELLGHIHPKYHVNFHEDLRWVLQEIEKGRDFKSLSVPWSMI